MIILVLGNTYAFFLQGIVLKYIIPFL